VTAVLRRRFAATKSPNGSPLSWVRPNLAVIPPAWAARRGHRSKAVRI